jgi:pilus assembly protein FimV
VATSKDKLKASAQRFDEKGQYDKALKEYLRVVAEDDADVRSWLKIGDLNIKLRRVEDAVAAYQRAAQLYGDQGFARKAVAVYKQIVKINPRLIAVHLRLADLCQELGLVPDALAHYEQVAAFYVREGKTEEALRVMLRMVGLDPNNASSRVKLAELYLKAQKTREATEQLQQAVASLRAQERTDDFFMKVAERLLFLSPDNHALARELAARYLDKSDPRRALPKLRQAYKANPRDPETLQLLAQAFIGLGQTAKAVSVLQEMARIYAENRDTVRRDETYRRILQLSPGDSEALSALRTAGSPSPSRVPPPPPPAAATAAAGPRSGDESISGPRRAATPAPGSTPGLGPPRRTPTPRPISVQRGGPPSAPPPTPAVSLGDWTALGPADREKEIARILEETDAYRKFGLHDMAVEHVKQVFEITPDHLGARERLFGLYAHLGRTDEAVTGLWALYQQAAGTPRGENYLREIVKLRPGDERAKRLLAELPPHALPPPPPATRRGAAPPAKVPEPLDAMDALEVVELGEDLVVEESSQASASIDIPIDEEIGLEIEELEGVQEAGEAHPPVSTQPSWPSLSNRIAPESQDEAGEALLIDDDDIDSLQIGPTEEPEQSFVGEPTASGWKEPITIEAGPGAAAQGAQRTRAPASVLEDELERSDYYLQQGFVGEARAILVALLERFPAHPLVVAKLRDLEQPEGELAISVSTPLPDGVPEEFDPLPHGIEPSVRVRLDPATMIEQSSSEDMAVAPEDFDTHYDLGIAYKEMGLLDEAVNEFRIVMQDPSREVQCHMMLGLIFLEQGRVPEAISQFKQGLYAERIQEREQLALYYELGNAYEKVSDTREALYYLEKVMKRDAQFRDVEQRVARLRGGGRRENLLVSVKDDIDQAFEGLVNDVMRGK